MLKAINMLLKVKCGRLMLTAECACSELSASRRTEIRFLDLNLHLWIFIRNLKNLCRIHMANESFLELLYFLMFWVFFFSSLCFNVVLRSSYAFNRYLQVSHTN